MAGSGGAGTFSSSRSPAELRNLVRKSEAETLDAEFEVDLSRAAGELLSGFNGRDTVLVNERLDGIKEILSDSIEGAFDQLFGGSVAKHTYVDGLSDIDTLVVLNDTGLENHSPQEALVRIEVILRKQLPSECEIERGRMAVTVTYPDGMTIQLLPAFKTREGELRVPSSRRDGWSRIDPEKFRNALTKRNNECGNKLIPTIKLAKAIIATLPEDQRLSGYHIESLAISAFKGYEGQKTTTEMLPVLFERAKVLVLSPIKDSTGQSIHVDGYLGDANSKERVVASHLLARLEKRLRNAAAAGSVAQWKALFGAEDE